MKWNRKKGIWLTGLMLCLLFLNKRVDTAEIKSLSDVEFSVGQDEDGGFYIGGDSTGKETGDYSSYLYSQIPVNISSYDGAAVTVSNEGNGRASIIPSFRNNSGNTVYLKKNAIYVEEKDNRYYVQNIIDTGFILEPESERTIYIPFSSFSDSLAIEDSWNPAAEITIPQNVACRLHVKKTKWIKNTKESKWQEALGASITGTDSIEIPANGERSAKFGIAGDKKKDFSFIPIHNKEAVMFSEEGILTLNDNAEAERITIQAINSDNICILKQITLYQATNQGEKNALEETTDVPADKSGGKLIFTIVLVIVVVCGGIFLYRNQNKE